MKLSTSIAIVYFGFGCSLLANGQQPDPSSNSVLLGRPISREDKQRGSWLLHRGVVYLKAARKAADKGDLTAAQPLFVKAQAYSQEGEKVQGFADDYVQIAGESLFLQGRYREASRYLEKAPGDAQSKLRLIICYCRLNEGPTAFDLARPFCEKMPYNNPFFMVSSDLPMYQNHSKDSVEATALLLLSSEVVGGEGRYIYGETLLQEADVLAPQTPAVQYLLGDLYRSLGLRREAHALLTSALPHLNGTREIQRCKELLENVAQE